MAAAADACPMTEAQPVLVDDPGMRSFLYLLCKKIVVGMIIVH